MRVWVLIDRKVNLIKIGLYNRKYFKIFLKIFLIFSFIVGFLFISPNFTGKVVANINNIPSSYLGTIFLVFGILGLLIYSRSREEVDEPTTTRIYDSRDELIYALKNLGWNARDIEGALKHEDAHMKEAVRRGYKPKYCIGISEDIGANKYRAGITLDREASREDLSAILSAPVELSDLDKQSLRLIRKKVKKDEF